MIALKWHTAHPLITTAALDNLVRVWDARSGTNQVMMYAISVLVLSV